MGVGLGLRVGGVNGGGGGGRYVEISSMGGRNASPLHRRTSSHIGHSNKAIKAGAN